MPRQGGPTGEGVGKLGESRAAFVSRRQVFRGKMGAAGRMAIARIGPESGTSRTREQNRVAVGAVVRRE